MKLQGYLILGELAYHWENNFYVVFNSLGFYNYSKSKYER